MNGTQESISESLAAFGWTHVYIIYSADVTGETSESELRNMSPACHVLQGYGDISPARMAASKAFTQTEGDQEYDYGYLAREGSDPSLAGVHDDGLKCVNCGADIGMNASGEWEDWSGSDDETFCPASEDGHSNPASGRHRKWVGELTREQWRAFADAFCIDLDDNDLPEEYNETMGSLTEYGHLDAISVDNNEGWYDFCSRHQVIDSNFYLSFGRVDE